MKILIGIIGFLYIISNFILAYMSYGLYKKGIITSYVRISMKEIKKLTEKNRENLEIQTDLNNLKRIYLIYFSLFVIEASLVFYIAWFSS